MSMKTPCLCPACTATPARTYTEKFRHECEVRHVARLVDKLSRKRYLVLVAKARGEPAMRKILGDLRNFRERAAA